jgi:hypothetical protein
VLQTCMEKDGGETAVDLPILDAESDIGSQADQDLGIESGNTVVGLVLLILRVGHDGAEDKHEEHEKEGGEGDVGLLEVGLDEFDVVVSDDA